MKTHLLDFEVPTSKPMHSLCGKPFVWLSNEGKASCPICNRIRAIQKRSESIQNVLKEECSGSGIDCDWEFDLKKHILYAKNSFHTMNDAGYYVGYADFTLRIDINHPEEFSLTFNGQRAHALNRRYGLREYLEDTIACSLTKPIK